MNEFLQRVLPADGDFVVTAIRPGGKAFEVLCPTQPDAVAAISRLSTKPLNVYIAIGSYDKNRRSPKAKRSLYLDLDKKDFGGDKLKALRELVIFCKTIGLPPPAILVDSGNGYHCYWPFAADLEVAPWRALAASLKAKCEELGFAADPTCTADAARILRVPTTLNHKSNPPLPCRVVQDNGHTFVPSDLMKILVRDSGFAGVGIEQAVPAKAAPPAVNDELSGGLDYDKPTPEDVAGMLPHVKLPATQSRLLWLAILQGLHNWSAGSEEGFVLAHDWSATQSNYKSEGDVRKVWVSFKGAGFGRGEVTIGTVIHHAKQGGWSPPTEPEPAQPAEVPEIPEDVVLEEAMGGESFQARVQSAVQKVRTEAVAAAEAAGKVRAPAKDMESILARQFVYVKNQDTYYSMASRELYTKESIRDIFTPDMPRTKSGVPLDPCDVLRRSPKKVIVDSLGFHPGEGAVYEEHGKEYVNKYVHPDGELVPTPQEARLFADFVDYLFPRPEDQTFKRYWLQFLAHAVQHPGTKIATALLFISETYGIGKSTAAYEIPRLLVGRDNARMVTNEILERPFTGYLGEAHLIHLQEVHVNGHWNASTIANRLKGIVTDSTVNVHRKGKDDYDIPNRLLVTATSNFTDAMYISSNQDRRWGIYELRPTRGYNADQHRKYFNVIHRFLHSGRASGVLRYIFKRLSLAGFDPQNPPPMTVAKERMAYLSMSEDEQTVADAYTTGSHPFHRDVFHMDEIRLMIQAETGKLLSSQRISKWIGKVVPGVQNIKQVRLGAGRLQILCCRNHSRWKLASSERLQQELKT